MTRGLVIVSWVMILGAAAPASAQWNVAAFVGDAWNRSADLRIASAPDTALTLADVEYDNRSFEFPLYYGVRAGRPLGGRWSWLGIEAEFIHLKTITRPTQLVEAAGQLSGRTVPSPLPLGDVLPRFELSHGLNFILANVVVRTTLGGRDDSSDRVALAFRGGLGPTIPHVEGTLQGRDEDAYQWSSLGWQAAGGVEVRLRGPVHVLSELKWTGTRQDVGIGDARVRGSFRATHLVFGLGVRPTDRD